jgi:hypothetical protein
MTEQSPQRFQDRRPDRIRSSRHVQAIVAADTFTPLADRVERMLSHGRRICLATRGSYLVGEMDVQAGLTLARVERTAPEGRCVFEVVLEPGLRVAFGFASPTGVNAVTEQVAWARFYAGDGPYNITKLTLQGGLAADGPARDDRITIDRWNDEGVRTQMVVVFDPGPDPAVQAVANVRALLPYLSGEAKVAVTRALDSDVWSVAGAETIR